MFCLLKMNPENTKGIHNKKIKEKKLSPKKQKKRKNYFATFRNFNFRWISYHFFFLLNFSYPWFLSQQIHVLLGDEVTSKIFFSFLDTIPVVSLMTKTKHVRTLRCQNVLIIRLYREFFFLLLLFLFLLFSFYFLYYYTRPFTILSCSLTFFFFSGST